jgi:hypothetical protein
MPLQLSMAQTSTLHPHHMKTVKSTRPSHLFVGCSGELCDTRKKDWHKGAPLRPVYEKTFARIETAQELKATLRAGEYAWPGGYPLYFITSDGGALSFQTVRDNLSGVLDSIKTRCDDGLRVVACQINFEDPAFYDDHTGERIPSAYAEEDAA